MTSTAFEAALKESDNDASRAHLHKLVAAAEYSGSTLPSVAEGYLRAFCNTAYSHVRRRWAGLALAGMLYASPEVVAHMKAVKRELQGLSEIILSNAEQEETKIIAGVVIRQALEQRIEFASFWSSDKVRNSAPNFPEASGPRWMSNFQSFLDTLGDLALANPITDPCILYPVSLGASDGFRWASLKDGLPVAIVQQESLTVLLPDDLLRTIQFLEVPITHIQSTKTQPSAPLPDSQARSTKHEPWDLVFTLRHDAWTYFLNSSKCTAAEITILFSDQRDARECEVSIRELQEMSRKPEKPPKARPMMSSSSLLDISLTPLTHAGGLATQRQQQRLSEPSNLVAKQRRQHICRSDAVNTNRVQQPIDQRAEDGQPSSDQLGKSPKAKIQSPQPPQNSTRIETSREPPDQSLEHIKSARRQQASNLPQKQDISELTQNTAHVESAWVQKQTKSAQKLNQVKRVQTQRPTEVAPNEVHALSSTTKRLRARTRAIKVCDEANSVPNDMTSPAEDRASKRATSKRTTYGKGKLPKISQATKQRASQQLRKQPDVFDLPKENHGKSGTNRRATPEEDLSARQSSRTQVTNAKTACGGESNTSQGRKTRSKRKREDDDDFVPSGWTTVKKTGGRCKSSTEATATNKETKKKAKIERKVTIGSASGGKRDSLDEDRAQHTQSAQGDEPTHDAKTRRLKSKRSEKPPSSVVSSRTPLIGGLLGLQRPSQAAKAAFKKPTLPSRGPHPPSTPTQCRSQPSMPTTRPHTPTTLRRPPNAVVPLVSSSPPLNSMAEQDQTGTQHGATETEILSSNSKPVPASPHAESTAISGHADQDDVDLEKVQADMQTARLDPFTQRRERHKATSFIRRLTGNDKVNDEPDTIEGLSHALPIEIDASASSDTEHLLVEAASQPLPQPRLAGKRGLDSVKVFASVSQPYARTPDIRKVLTRAKVERAHTPVLHDQQEEARIVQAPLSLKSKVTATIEGSSDIPKKKATTLAGQGAYLERIAVLPRKSASARDEHKSDAKMNDSILNALQHAVDDTQAEHATEPQDDFDMDGNTTFVNDESEELPTNIKASPMRFRSSPPLPGSPSSHSSTSAEPGSSSQPPIPTSQAEEMEWEATLQPHQRALHDLLIRVSNRVLRHIVDSETAVTNIAEVFASDGQHLLQEVLQRHNRMYAEVWEHMESKKTAMKKDMEKSARTLANERKRISAIT